MSDWRDDSDYYEHRDHPPLNDLLFGDSFDVDPRAFELFTEAMFDGDAKAYRALVDYMWDTYEIDFEDAFDWEDFRAWYESQN